MNKRQCLVCGHVYDPTTGDPANGIAPGTVFDHLPEEWVCPDCGAHKDMYQEL